MQAVFLLCCVAAASAQYYGSLQHPLFYSQSYLPLHSNVKYHANSGGVQHTVFQNKQHLIKREAEAEPIHYSSNLGYTGYTGYTGYSGFSPLSYGYNSHISKPFYQTNYWKREAEAEPIHYGSNLGYTGYTGYTGYSGYSSPLSYGYNSHISKPFYQSNYWKREAEAEPYLTKSFYSMSMPYHTGVSSYYNYQPQYYNTHSGIYKREADPQMYMNQALHHQTPYFYNAYQPAFYKPTQAMTYSNDFVSNKMYAAKGQYKAITPGSMHIAKREADPALMYKSFGYPLTHNNYGTYGSYGSYLPYNYQSSYYY